MKLMLCKKAVYHDRAVDTTWYDMGEFTEPVVSSLSQLEDTASRIKEYANYVFQSYRRHNDLRGCPSYEIVEWVDDRFNPIY